MWNIGTARDVLVVQISKEVVYSLLCISLQKSTQHLRFWFRGIEIENTVKEFPFG